MAGSAKADDELLGLSRAEWQSPARPPKAVQLRTQEPPTSSLGPGRLRYFPQGSTVNATEITCTR